MPVKQTETMEAESTASAQDRLAADIRDVRSGLRKIEKEVEGLEDIRGLPAFYRSKSLPDRMAVVGMRKEAIELVQACLDALGRATPAKGF